MEQLLWSFEGISRFLDHPDGPVRRWAVERLIKLFPERAGDVLVTRLDDDYPYIFSAITKFLAETGDTERYGPVLLAHLDKASEDEFGRIALALGQLHYEAALPRISQRCEEAFNGEKPFSTNEPFKCAHALGLLGGKSAREIQWRIWNQLPEEHWSASYVMDKLFLAREPGDVEKLFTIYRERPSGRGDQRMLEGFASSVHIGRLANEAIAGADDGFDRMLEDIEQWMGCPIKIEMGALEAMAEAFDIFSYDSFYKILTQEARRITEEKGDKIAQWKADWEANKILSRYKEDTVLSFEIIETIAANPDTTRTRRQMESALAFSVLCEMSIQQDDEAVLEAAEDKTETLLNILSDCRENVLPDIIQRVADLGPEIVPRLIAPFDPDSFSWGMIRIVDVIAKIARRHPGSCNDAVPVLIEATNDEQSDYLLESCSCALAAIGPDAVPMISQHLDDDDMSRRIYMTGTLGDIPTESSAQAILQRYNGDELQILSLESIGSASAIETLYKNWKSNPVVLAEPLLVLCQLNGVEKPEIPKWREIVENEKKRAEKFISGSMISPEEKQASAVTAHGTEYGKARSAPKQKTISKAEKKKRAANRLASKSKKKRKR